MSTILVVDDEAPLRSMLADVLEEAGYVVLQASDGQQALALLRSAQPDLVLSDVMMPLLNGIELCRQVKATPATAALPVILMSAAGRSQSTGTRADAFIDKPFDIDVVEALVRQLLAPPPAAVG